MAVNPTPEEEAIIKKRFLTHTATTAVSVQPPFKRLTKRCALSPLAALPSLLAALREANIWSSISPLQACNYSL